MNQDENQMYGTVTDRGYSRPPSVDQYRGYGEEDQSGPNWFWVAAGAVLALAGGYFVYRGLSSHESDGATKRTRKLERGKGIQVDESITVQKPVGEIYGYWRELENLPHIMSHLESVENLGMGRSRWVANAPAGAKVEWDAEMTEDRPNELISWRSVAGADVPNEGTVRFKDRGASTEVDVSLRYVPPGGAIGAVVAKLFGEEPSQQIGDDLRKFKVGVESGQITTSTYS